MKVREHEALALKYQEDAELATHEVALLNKDIDMYRSDMLHFEEKARAQHKVGCGSLSLSLSLCFFARCLL